MSEPIEAPDSKWKEMAEKNTILRVVVGSEAYGTSVGASSDRDEKGVCMESLEAFGAFNPFEQYEFRTAVTRTGDKWAKSGEGDLDLTIYGLRKFLRLALSGNPSIIEMLYIKKHVKINALGTQLQELAPNIISRRCGGAFLGYMQSQRQRLLGEIGQKKVNRPDLEEKYGFDTKYAMHILRLGHQGRELLTTGSITIPIEADFCAFLRQVREGEVPLQKVLEAAGNLEREVKDLLDTSPLPKHPDVGFIEGWMQHRYWEWWKGERVIYDRSTWGEKAKEGIT